MKNEYDEELVSESRKKYNQMVALSHQLSRIRSNMEKMAQSDPDDTEFQEEYERFAEALNQAFVVLGGCLRRLDYLDNG